MIKMTKICPVCKIEMILIKPKIFKCTKCEYLVESKVDIKKHQLLNEGVSDGK